VVATTMLAAPTFTLKKLQRQLLKAE